MDEFSGRVLEWTTIDQDPDLTEDGDEFFRWVGSDEDFYLLVRNPATGGLCTECDFALDLLDASSGISGSVSALVDGVALVRIRSTKAYDDPTQPAIFDAIVTITDTAKITKDGAVVGGNKIKMGLPVTLEGENYKFNGTISDVRVSSDANVDDNGERVDLG